MPAKFVIFMTLLTSGSANPHHDPDIQISIEQGVNAGNGGGGFVRTLCSNMGGFCRIPNRPCPKSSPIRYYQRVLTLKYCGIEGTSPVDKTDCCAPAPGQYEEPQGWVYKVDLENALLFALTNNFQYNALKVSTTNGKDRTKREYTYKTRKSIMNFLKLIIDYLRHGQFQDHTYFFIKELYDRLDGIGIDLFTVENLQKNLNDIQRKGRNKDGNLAYLSAWQPSVGCQCIRSTACYVTNWLYTCGMWQILHSITVAALWRSDSVGLDVIKAIGGYIRDFTDCNTCRIHFNEMYNKTVHKAPDKVKDTYDAVLWLWCAHNFVNQVSTKSYPPHPQFPLHSACPDCWTNNGKNCAQLFCPNGEDHCWETTEDQGVNIKYHKFDQNAVVIYLLGTYYGSYNDLNTNWQRIPDLFKVNDKCPSKRYPFE